MIVNGRFRADLSDLDGLPSGLGITPLADALRAGNAVGQGRTAEDGALVDSHPFAALNGAFLTDGVLIEIAARAEIERLIHVVIASKGDAAYMPRIVIAAGEGSRASVVESRVGEASVSLQPRRAGPHRLGRPSRALRPSGGDLGRVRHRHDADRRWVRRRAMTTSHSPGGGSSHATRSRRARRPARRLPGERRLHRGG